MLSRLKIMGLGTAVPQHAWPQAVAAEFAEKILNGAVNSERRVIPALYRRAGAKTRHSVLLKEGLPGELAVQDFFAAPSTELPRGPGTAARMRAYAEHAPALACAAGRVALETSGVDAGEITHLITVSCTGFAAPCLDLELVNALGLPRDVQRTHVGFMGCHGALNGLRVARAFAQGDAAARVLLVAVELCSLHFHYGNDPEQMVANALFADGAAALVACGVEGMQDGRSEEAGWALRGNGCYLLTESADAMTWRIGDHGFVMSLAARVPDLIEGRLRDWICEWLAAHGLALGDVGSWAVHPGGPRILQSVQNALGLAPEALVVSRETLQRYGNMSSPTIMFILKELAARAAARPCVALGFGPGLAIEAALFD